MPTAPEKLFTEAETDDIHERLHAVVAGLRDAIATAITETSVAVARKAHRELLASEAKNAKLAATVETLERRASRHATHLEQLEGRLRALEHAGKQWARDPLPSLSESGYRAGSRRGHSASRIGAR